MSIEPIKIPTKEQMLYAQLAIVESLMSYIRENTEETLFDDDKLISTMDTLTEGLSICHRLMQILMLNSQERKSVCY